MRTLSLLAVLFSVLAQFSPTACSLVHFLDRDGVINVSPAPGDTHARSRKRIPHLCLSCQTCRCRGRNGTHLAGFAEEVSYRLAVQFMLQQPILQHFEMGRKWELALAHYRSLPNRQQRTARSASAFTTAP
jgi:hypothetical protein